MIPRRKAPFKNLKIDFLVLFTDIFSHSRSKNGEKNDMNKRDKNEVHFSIWL